MSAVLGISVSSGILNADLVKRTLDFENVGQSLGSNNAWNGLTAPPSEVPVRDLPENDWDIVIQQFTVDGIGFTNRANQGYQSWYGFGISTKSNTAVVPDYTNDMVSKTGTGAGGSSAYGVAFWATDGFDYIDYGYVDSLVMSLPTGALIESMQITNTLYAHDSIRNGDWLAPAIGTGDYFTLLIDALDADGNAFGTQIAFDLARDNFVLDYWTTLDLSEFSGAATLSFSFDSNIKDAYGILYPAYFAFDDIVYYIDEGNASTPEPATLLIFGLGLAGLGLVRRKKS
ncbi:MAG: DUF4465 domain-containing protein [Planctomycetaceae bacterium]|nr:DUF4465 domain-containing protein [Planctomycetaceae bacterium]